MSYPINWDLESIFPGGITSPQLQARIQAVAAEIPTVASASPTGMPAPRILPSSAPF